MKRESVSLPAPLLAGILIAGVALGGHPLARAANNESRQKHLSRSARETLALNEKTGLGFNEQSRLLLREVRIENGGSGLQDAFKGLLRTTLLEAGVAFVTTPEELRRETQERREERANDEVQQSQLPPKQTILRETTEVKAVLTLVRSSKDAQGLVALLASSFPIIGGFSYQKKDATALITLEVWDNKTQTSRNQLNALGREGDTTNLIIAGYPLAYRQARSDQDRRDLKAIESALENLRLVVQHKLTDEYTPLQGHVLNFDRGYVILDIGSDNGVKPGMLFAVEPLVETGNIETPLPAIARARVVTLSGNSCSAELTEGKLEALQVGDRVTEVTEKR